jgi:putative flippase GtrA
MAIVKLGKFRSIFSVVKFSKFTVVGILGAVIDNSVLNFLAVSMSFPLVHSKLIGAEIAIISMFLLNENWTFSGESLGNKSQTLIRFMKSNLVRSVGVIVATLVMVAIVEKIGTGYRGIDLILANTIGITTGLIVNYVLESLITWQVGNE